MAAPDISGSKSLIMQVMQLIVFWQFLLTEMIFCTRVINL